MSDWIKGQHREWRWGRNGTVIVASQRLGPKGLGDHLVRKPEMWSNLWKVVPGKERAGLHSTLVSGYPNAPFIQ